MGNLLGVHVVDKGVPPIVCPAVSLSARGERCWNGGRFALWFFPSLLRVAIQIGGFGQLASRERFPEAVAEVLGRPADPAVLGALQCYRRGAFIQTQSDLNRDVTVVESGIVSLSAQRCFAVPMAAHQTRGKWVGGVHPGGRAEREEGRDVSACFAQDDCDEMLAITPPERVITSSGYFSPLSLLGLSVLGPSLPRLAKGKDLDKRCVLVWWAVGACVL